MNIIQIFSRMNRMASTAHESDMLSAQKCAAACELFLVNRPQLQVSFLSGLVWLTYECYRNSMFSGLGRIFFIDYWERMSGESKHNIRDLLDFVGNQVAVGSDGRNFRNDWQELDQEFAQRLARRVVSAEIDEDDGLWMLDPNLVDDLRGESYQSFPDIVVREFKSVMAEAQARPLHLLSWRLQAAVNLPINCNHEASVNIGSDSMFLAERLTGLLALLLEHTSPSGVTLLKTSPVTVEQMLACIGNVDTAKNFDTEIIEHWLTSGLGKINLEFLQLLCAQAKNLGLLFRVPIRISPKLTKDGFGLTSMALNIAEPFRQRITNALLKTHPALELSASIGTY